MATSTVPVSIVKKQLRNIPMYINNIQTINGLELDYIQWKICRFRKLNKGIDYKNYISELSWYLHLYIDRQTLFVKVVPKDFKNPIQCFLVYAPGNYIHVQETARYEYQIPFATIQSPKNKHYEKDLLRLEFRYMRSELTPAIHPFMSGRNDLEAIWLKNDINHSYFVLNDFEPNFLLRLTNGSVYLQKAALAARCKFFYDYFKDHPDATEYRLDTSIEIMIKLKSFILSGSTSELTELQEIMDLLSIASFLKVPSLQSECERVLKRNINHDNVYIVRDAGIKKAIESLVRIADNFLGETCKLRDFGNSVERFFSKSYKKGGNP